MASRRRALISGAAGVALIVSLFLPWADAGGASRTGWQLLTTFDVFLLIVGVFAILAPVTGGRIGVFRPDVSLIGATDILSVVASVLVAWFLVVDFPDGASRDAGVWVALVASIAVAGGAGDYRVFRGAPLFPRLR